MNNKIDGAVVSPLYKVFLDDSVLHNAGKNVRSVLRGEPFIFMAAFRKNGDEDGAKIDITVKACGETAEQVQISLIQNVPSEMASYIKKDENYLKEGKPGLYPDLLLPLSPDQTIACSAVCTQAVWVEYLPKASDAAGEHEVILSFADEQGEELLRLTQSVELIDTALSPQKLKFTQWFHADCISEYYKVESFGDDHFALLSKYIKTAAQNGINMLLTPLFTPPLDTMVGGERPTTQLVRVEKTANGYQFDFSLLKRFIDCAKECGITYFEMSHLFTQWGAKSAPKIMCWENGIEKRLFFWEDSSTGERYTAFLDTFLPQLTAFLKAEGVAQNTYFHVSDEPSAEDLPQYQKCKAILAKHLAGFKLYDALSNIEFYENGAITIPVPAVDHIKPFLKADIKERWAYYCCGQSTKVSNRFFSMPSSRNRIIAPMLYKYEIDGFLHWGYNFWYKQFSKGLIDPFHVTDAGMGFPSGDAFSVYPGKDGPLASIRLRVFYQALCDMRAMKRLEELSDKATVMELIEQDDIKIEFDTFPCDYDYIIDMRNRINEKIKELL